MINLELEYQFCIDYTINHSVKYNELLERLSEKYSKHFYAIYSFLRESDNIVDEQMYKTPQEIKDDLDLYKKKFYTAWEAVEITQHPIFIAFISTCRTLNFPQIYIDQYFSFLEKDINFKDYQNHDELKEYLHSVSGITGIFISYVFGLTDEKHIKISQEFGEYCGLGNTLEDMQQDYNLRKRIYLPKDEREKLAVEDMYFSNVKDNFNKLEGLINIQTKKMSNIESKLGQLFDLYPEEGKKVAYAIVQKYKDITQKYAR